MIDIRQGDCLELLKTLPDKSVDMVLTDPPYGTINCKWDNVIALEPMWEQLKRVVKDNGAICLFGSEPFSSHLRFGNLCQYKYDWYWVKSRKTGFVHAKNKPLKNIELISVFSAGTTVHKQQSDSRMTYNPQGLQKISAKHRNGKSKFGNTVRKSHSNQSYYEQNYTNYPCMTLFFDSVSKNLHPTQKPTDLLEYLIKTYTHENETVLDFTMGSGSTGIACLNTNRKFIGFELDEHYFNVAKERIEKHLGE